MQAVALLRQARNKRSTTLDPIFGTVASVAIVAVSSIFIFAIHHKATIRGAFKSGDKEASLGTSRCTSHLLLPPLHEKPHIRAEVFLLRLPNRLPV